MRDFNINIALLQPPLRMIPYCSSSIAQDSPQNRRRSPPSLTPQTETSR